VSFLGVSDQLIRKYCSKGKKCFWGYTGLVEPTSTRELYLFDCSLFNYVKEEYREYPELRILLSFKAGVSPGDMWFTSQMEYPSLVERAPCTISDIENCIKNSISTLDKMIQEYYSLLKSSKKELAKLTPRPLSYAEIRGRYYGLLLRRDFLSKIVSSLGYDSGVLKSRVKPIYVLYSIDLSKWDFTALTGNKHIKLGAHKKLIDVEKIINTVK